jgi:hypothetical protein
MWLQSRGGEAWLGRALAREASERLGLTLTVGRISGSFVRGVRIEQIALHDAEGRLVARADALSAHYRLRRLLRLHEVDELAIEGPAILRTPALRGSAASSGKQASFSVRHLRVSDGSLRWGDHQIQHVRASLAMDHGRLTATLDALELGRLRAHGSVTGPLDALELTLSGHTDDGGVAARGLIDVPRRSASLGIDVEAPHATLHARGALHDGALEVTELQAHAGATRLDGAAHVTTGGIEGRFAATVAPAEAARIGIAPTAPIRLEGSLQGPARALDLRVHGRLRAGRVALAGRIDLGARRGRVRFHARDVRVSDIQRAAPDLFFSGAFVFDGALRERSVDGTMSVTEGSVRIARLHFDRLHGSSRVQLGQPGLAQVEGLTGRLVKPRPRRLELDTVVRWDGRSLRFGVSHAFLEASRAVGEVVYAKDPVTHRPMVTIEARQLLLSPPLVQEALGHRPRRAWPGTATFVWTPVNDRVSFALDTARGTVRGSAWLRRLGPTLEVPRLAVTLGKSYLRGAARVRNGVLVASIDELLVQPELIRSLKPELTPRRPLHIQGAVAGPSRALDVRLHVTSGPSAAMVSGRLDLPDRRFELEAALDTFQMERAKDVGQVTLELSLQGRFVEGGVAGTLAVRHARGRIKETPLYRGRLDAQLDGPRFELKQALFDLPGVTVEAKGRGSYRDFHVKYGLVVTDALALKQVPPSLRVMIGLTQLVPGRSVEGSVKRQGGGKLEVTHVVIPPGVRWLALIYDLLRGKPPKLTVD